MGLADVTGEGGVCDCDEAEQLTTTTAASAARVLKAPPS